MKLLIAVIASAALVIGSWGIAHAEERHLFYVHGCCIKNKDDPKVKAYETIVQELRDSGLNVFFELRTADINDGDDQAMAYAAKIADRVRDLLDRGTAAEDITVAGYSLGARITLVASGLIANPKVNFVLLAGCPFKSTIPIDYSKVKGRLLSIRDTKDDKFGSCDGRLPDGVTYKEIVLASGEGHALFRLPDKKYLNLWKEPLLNWSEGK
jgi:hypothetical protein